VIPAIPDVPPTMASQVDHASQPTGETMPMPVTTMLGPGWFVELVVLIDLLSISSDYPTTLVTRSTNTSRKRPDPHRI
jgi:hypothetical protein